MSSLFISINSIIPIYVVLAVGYISRLCGLLNRDDVIKFNKIIFTVFLSVQMFNSIYTADISSVYNIRLIVFSGVTIIIIFLLSILFVKVIEKNKDSHSVMVQGLFKSNFVIVGLPVALSFVDGNMSDVAGLLIIGITMFNIIGVINLVIFGREVFSFKSIIIKILKNPMIIGSLSGAVFLVGKIIIPDPIYSAVNEMSKVGSPLMIFLLGAFFDFHGFREKIRPIIIVTIGRLIVIPAVFLTVACLFGFRDVELAGLLSIYGSATATNSFTLTQQIGGDAELAGDIIVATSALCPFTLVLFGTILKTTGML